MVNAGAGEPREADTAEAIFRAEDELLSLGCRVGVTPFALVLHDPSLPLIYDVNGLRDVRGRPTLEQLRRACDVPGSSVGRHLRLVARAPETVRHLDALLLPLGFSRQVCLAMALEGSTPSPPIPHGLELLLVDPDDDALLRAVAAGQDLVRREEPWYGVEVSRQMDELALRQMRLGGAEFLAAVTARGAVVGSLLLRCSGGVAFIADVGTVPRERRRGVASALVAAAAAVGRDRGCATVGLTARRDGNPRRIYGDLGFVAVGESVDWLRAGPLPLG
ncbi:MAG TPA: GNAT family N-acetyltransferase [Vulgatibacter sp.]|nr:GNAT family N-acetyltransferase [Vulgatibacter sp.]